MQKTYEIEQSGSRIRVVNSWFSGAKLYIDGDMKDFDNSYFASPKGAMLSGSFVNKNGEREVIEVFAKSNLITVGWLITSNGKEIFREKY